MSLFRAWTPYILLVALLVITRVVDPLPAFLQGEPVEIAGTTITAHQMLFTTTWEGIFGTGLSGGIEWVYVPGFWLILCALIAIPLYGMSGTQVKAAWAEAGELVAPFIALVFVIAMVQVMLQSGAHAEGVESMIFVLAQATADAIGPAYPFVAALIGALGAAMAGSNTVSNITFGGFQFEAASQLELPTQLIVGAQAVGGAIRNLVAIHNIVAALATVGLVGQEGRVMRLNLIPLAYYAIGWGSSQRCSATSSSRVSSDPVSIASCVDQTATARKSRNDDNRARVRSWDASERRDRRLSRHGVERRPNTDPSVRVASRDRSRDGPV